jgi:hypothetical protein
MKQILVGFCIFTLVLTSASAADRSILPAEIQSRIDAMGSRKVLWDLWEHETEFDQVLSGIESANPKWLRIAVELRKFSDAGASEALDSSVALALPKAPELVLALVGHGFNLEFVCTSPFIEPEPGVAEAYERKTLASLAAVKAPNLKSLAAECSRRVRLPPTESPGA